MSKTNTLFFGGPGGGFTPIHDIGDEEIIIYAGNVIDAIQIGNTRFGGAGGAEAGRATLPPDGRFQIHEIQAGSDHGAWVIGYLHITIDGKDIWAGQKAPFCDLKIDIEVKLSGINHGKYVDALQLDIIDS